MHHEVIEALEGQPFQWLRVISWTGLAMIARRRGDPDAAERWLVPAWELRRTQTVPHMQAYVLAARGYTADQRGEGASALALQRRALDLQVEVGNPRGVAYALEGVAGAIAVLDDDGPLALGARLLGRADGLRRATGGAMPAAERFDVDRAERRLRERLGDEVFDLDLRDGSTSSTDELVAAVRSLDLP
jgi:hypothetical protein